MSSSLVQTRNSSTKDHSPPPVHPPKILVKRDSAGIFNGSCYTSAGAFAGRHIAARHALSPIHGLCAVNLVNFFGCQMRYTHF